MSTYNALWIDDIRDVPDDCDKHIWTSAKSFHEAIVKLELIDFEHVSFDHDIDSFYGYTEMTGNHVALWLATRKMQNQHVPLTYAIHSANPVGRKNIAATITRYLDESFKLKR